MLMSLNEKYIHVNELCYIQQVTQDFKMGYEITNFD